MPTDDSHRLNHRSINETSNQCRGGGVWEKYKWAFNDAMDPSESEREAEEITIIKHLIFPKSDSVAFTRLHLHPVPLWKKEKSLFDLSFFLSSSLFPLFFLPVSVSGPLCVKNKEGTSSCGDEKAAEGQRDIWVWYFQHRPKCLVSTNLLPGNPRDEDWAIQTGYKAQWVSREGDRGEKRSFFFLNKVYIQFSQ